MTMNSSVTTFRQAADMSWSLMPNHIELYHREILSAAEADGLGVRANSVLWEKIGVGGSVLPHYHNVAEIIHITKGKVRLLADGKWLSFRAGDTFHVPAGVVHSVANDDEEPTEQISIFLPVQTETPDNVFFETTLVPIPAYSGNGHGGGAQPDPYAEAKIEAALPYPFAFVPERTALIVIDMQNDFCSPGGFGELLGNDIAPVRRIVPTVASLLEAARQAGLAVIHTREGHLPDLSDCPPAKLERSRRQGAGIGDEGPLGRILIRGERGHAIIDELAPLPGEPVIDKSGKGAFYNTELHSLLQQRGIEYLLLCGVTTHVCVHTTLREANDRGYRCLVLEDGTAAFDPADQEAALRMVRQQGGIFGWTSTVAELLGTLTSASAT